VGPVAAQEKTPTPSAQELWDAYPLEATPTPSVDAAETPAAAARERRAKAPAEPAEDGGALVPPLIAGLVLALGAVALIWTFRPNRGRRADTSRPVAAGAPALAVVNGAAPAPAKRTAPGPAKPAARKAPPAQKRAAKQPPAQKPAARQQRAARKRSTPKPGTQRPVAQTPPARRRRSESLLLSPADREAAEAPAASAVPAAHAAAAAASGSAVARAARPASATAPPRGLPPDPGRDWSAQIEWIIREGEARFAVLARTAEQVDDATVVTESPVLEWPPTSAAAVQALTDAVAELERTQLAAGWTALDSGPGWYAKRFAWTPVLVVEPAPPAANRPAAHAAARPAPPQPAGEQEPDRRGRFMRAPAWPEGTDRIWRCELRWDAGVVNSRFEAVAYGPGNEQHARPVASSATFKWLMMSDPDPAADDCRDELRRLGAALREAGWEHVGRGAKWYAARFVWRHPGKPPEEIAVGQRELSGQDATSG
jgi:hypothetical protein